jgi:stringent starvation protein B
MSSLKPYLIRAVYDWIVDNQHTPYLVVNATSNRGCLPEDYVEDGKIVLNLRPQAVEALSLGNDAIQFNARFGGKAFTVEVSMNAAMAIYAKENGKGMVFDPEEDGNGEPPPGPESKPPAKPGLRVVK